MRASRAISVQKIEIISQINLEVHGRYIASSTTDTMVILRVLDYKVPPEISNIVVYSVNKYISMNLLRGKSISRWFQVQRIHSGFRAANIKRLNTLVTWILIDETCF